MLVTPDMGFKVLKISILHIAVLYRKRTDIKKAIDKSLKHVSKNKFLK